MENRATSEDYLRDDEELSANETEEFTRSIEEFREKIKSISFSKVQGGARDRKRQ